jgi:protein subunit release factor B
MPDPENQQESPAPEPSKPETHRHFYIPEDDDQLFAECEMDTFRSGGPGGQHANTSDSAVRLRHLPSGIVVTCREERSQHRNRSLALEKLRERLRARNKPPRKRKKTRVPKGAKKKRLQNKRRRSDKKKLRQKPRLDD